MYILCDRRFLIKQLCREYYVYFVWQEVPVQTAVSGVCMYMYMCVCCVTGSS